MANNKGLVYVFQQIRSNIVVMKEKLPTLVANDTKNYFSKSFINQAWNGKQWKEVKRRIPGTPEYKYPKNKDLSRRTRWILVGKKSTKLRRAVANCARVRPQSWPHVVLIVDLPYARRHNEGLDGMPKRQFMGQTVELRNKQTNRIKTTIKDLVWPKF